MAAPGPWRGCLPALAMAAAVLLAPTVPAAGPPAGDPLAEGSRELDQVRSGIRQLLRGMERTEGDRDQLTRRLRQAEREIGERSRSLRSLGERLAGRQRQLEALRADYETALEELERQRSALGRQVRAAYVIGHQERLRLILNQQDPARVGRVLTYYDYLNRARARRMKAIRDRLAELAGIRTDIDREEQHLEALMEQQRSELAALEARQRERRVVLEDLSARLQDQGQELARLRRDEQRLRNLVEEIEQALLDIPVEVPGQERFSQLKGRLSWPAAGRLAARFGTPKGGSLSWDGVLISAEPGDEVKAVHHGRVAFADWLRGFGLLLIIDHGDGWMSLYGHNRSLFKEVGDWVQRGEPVALVGDTGGRGTAGLYFGIRHQGAAVDPLHWCLRPSGGRVGYLENGATRSPGRPSGVRPRAPCARGAGQCRV